MRKVLFYGLSLLIVAGCGGPTRVSEHRSYTFERKYSKDTVYQEFHNILISCAYPEQWISPEEANWRVNSTNFTMEFKSSKSERFWRIPYDKIENIQLTDSIGENPGIGQQIATGIVMLTPLYWGMKAAGKTDWIRVIISTYSGNNFEIWFKEETHAKEFISALLTIKKNR